MDSLGASALPARPASEWAQVLGGVLEGPEVAVEFACTLEAGSPGGISFLANPSYRRAWSASGASVVLAGTDSETPKGFGGSVIRVANPYAAWAMVLASGQRHVAWAVARPKGVDPSAVLAPGVQLAEDVEDELRLTTGEITSDMIGRAVLDQLRHLDEVVYLRFASVYKGFDAAADFQRELVLLKKLQKA